MLITNIVPGTSLRLVILTLGKKKESAPSMKQSAFTQTCIQDPHIQCRQLVSEMMLKL